MPRTFRELSGTSHCLEYGHPVNYAHCVLFYADTESTVVAAEPAQPSPQQPAAVPHVDLSEPSVCICDKLTVFVICTV